MRILIYAKKIDRNFKNTVKKLEEDYVTKIDLFDDYEEAEYCVDIRFYDLIILEFEEEKHSKLLNFFKYARDKNERSKIIMFGNGIKDFHLKMYERFGINQIIKEDMKHTKVKNIIKSEISTTIEHDILKVDVKEKKVWINKDGEHIEISFKKKTDFYVFLYFMRHYKETINVSNLLDATCEEPELTKDSIIESSISSLRKTFNELLGINPIKAFKKVGYNFSLQH